MTFQDRPDQWMHMRETIGLGHAISVKGYPRRTIHTPVINIPLIPPILRSRSPEVEWQGDLFNLEETANLTDQHPATLYYLALVKDIPIVVEVYVEELDHGRRKHWTVISDRDYDVMDDIYDLEEDTLDRFPEANLNFRITVQTDEGPSVSRNATKILDRT